MSKIAIIGASYLQLPLYLKAKELGYTTIGFSWPDGAIAKDYCSQFYPISIIDKEEILKICEAQKIDGILTIASDVAVTTVCYIAEKMSLVGNGIESATYSTNKYLMREQLSKAGLNSPKYHLISYQSDLNLLAKHINYPAIVKPVDRSGSKGVTKINSQHELEIAANNALEASLCKQAIVEEFINGTEVSVEMVSFNGQHYGLSITDKETTGAPHFVEIAHHQPSCHSPQLQNAIYEACKKGLDALNIKNGASHPEFIISSDGIYVTEIGARMGGDFIGSDLVYLSTGYDFLKGVIEISLGKFTPPVKSFQKFSGVYFYSNLTPRVGEIIKNKDDLPYIVQAEINDNPLSELTQSSDRSGYFIYQNDFKINI